MNVPLLRLASLDLLRGFVAVGRRMSITEAAKDLCLSQSAISRQVQALEETLGARLFKRGHRSLSFTAEGARLFAVADAALLDLQRVWGELSSPRQSAPVSVLSCIGFASLWLLPRLGQFQVEHPGIDVRLAAHGQPRDADVGPIDLTIRYCTEQEAPADALRLFDDLILPVAHPSLLQGDASVSDPSVSDLVTENTLLEFDNPRYPWLQWADFLTSLAPSPRPRGMLHFNQYSQVIQAALAGQGIALGRLALVEPLLREGKLVSLVSAEAVRPCAYAYWLICASDARKPAQILAEWIRQQALISDASNDAT
ncbi:MAG TPA: LysR substrate-binding domain-containing protein [Rhodocyclaceae bacterium]|nr:LysR substrate-binding domain-containing protein [Rhodocyclaceae bacterium]